MTRIRMLETEKRIRRAGLITAIYALICAASTGLLCYECIYLDRSGTPLSFLLLPLWMLNPMALVSSFSGIEVFLEERKKLKLKGCRFTKWMPFALYILGSAALWVISVIAFVDITGGA